MTGYGSMTSDEGKSAAPNKDDVKLHAIYITRLWHQAVEDLHFVQQLRHLY